MVEPRYSDPKNANIGSLTDEQVAFYHQEGYLVVAELLSDEDLAPIVKALNDKVDQIAKGLLEDGLIDRDFAEEPFEYRLAKMFEGLTDADFLKYGRSWRDRHPGYFRFISNAKIINMVASLLGPEVFANPVYNSRPKVPSVAAGAVPWHQDRSYWPGANANPVITVWIPLVDADEVNGCLRIWPRTQNTELLNHFAEQKTGTGYLEVSESDLGLKPMKRIQPVALPIKKGGAILFNDRCVHMSTPNLSDHVRWSVDLRYQPTDQDPMREFGAGFLCRSEAHPDKIATEKDWMEYRESHEA